jgi:hypothetical protein
MLFGDRSEMAGELDQAGGSLDSVGQPQQPSEPAAAPAQQPVVPQMSPQDIQAAFRGALSEHEMSKAEQDRLARESAEAWALPTISPEVMAEALTSPEKMLQLWNETNQIHNARLAATVQQFHGRILGQERVVQGLLEDAHAQAWDVVRERYKENGIDADKYYGEMELAIRKNPNNYWNIRRDPRAMASAVQYLHERATRGDIFSQTPQTPQGPPSFAGGAGPARGTSKTDTQTDPFIQRAERVLGIKFDKNSRADYFGGTRRSA